MKIWKQCIVEIAEKEPYKIDIVTNVFIENQAIGTEIINAQDYYENHENLFGEIPVEIPLEYLQAPSKILAYFDTDVNQDYIQGLLSKLPFSLQVSWQDIEEQNWQSNWMQFYQPERLSYFLTVVPLWSKYEAQKQEHVIVLDPGLAFGTGNHPTTRLACQALEISMLGGEEVIDVGCGTGILSFVASSLGASKVSGYDLDPQAVQAAKQNLAYQRDPEILKLKKQNLIDFSENNLLQGLEMPTDIIVANILPHILVDLFEDAYRLLREDGHLIIGGIIDKETKFIEQNIEKHGFKIVHHSILSHWHNYILEK